MNIAAIRSLQARIRNATGPDRGLDRAIADALLGKSHPINRRTLPPTYTGSLDACVALQEQVLPGWDWSMRHSVSADGDIRYGNAVVWEPSDPRDEDALRFWENHEHSPCLAMVLAIFAAVIAREEAKETETMP